MKITASAWKMREPPCRKSSQQSGVPGGSQAQLCLPINIGTGHGPVEVRDQHRSPAKLCPIYSPVLYLGKDFNRPGTQCQIFHRILRFFWYHRSELSSTCHDLRQGGGANDELDPAGYACCLSRHPAGSHLLRYGLLITSLCDPPIQSFDTGFVSIPHPHKAHAPSPVGFRSCVSGLANDMPNITAAANGAQRNLSSIIIRSVSSAIHQ